MSRFAVRVLVSLAVAALAACGGGEGASPKKTSDGGKITGLVVKGVVQNATVTAYRLDASLTRGAALGYGPTGADGTFSLSVPPYNGPVEVVANGGTYLEEAVGVPVQLTRELSSVIPSFQSGSTVSVTLTPVSSIAASFARAEVSRGSLLADAVASAWTHVNNHFGGLDWRTITPTDLTPNDPVTVTMSDATKAGLVLAGLSQSARVLSESSGLSPGTSVTGATLAGAAIDDARDGTLNGVGPGGALSQGSVGLSGQTLRRSLGQSVLQFVQSDRNHTQLTGADVLALGSAIAANSDPYLFCPNQIASASCAGGPIELTPAAIAFVDPPTFVGATTVTLTVSASQPVAGVSAVYAQTAAGSGQVPGVLAGGNWTIASIPLVEGPNLISVWGVDGSGGGSIANATTISVTRDTIPPAPYLEPSTPAYVDERLMHLVDGTVPAKYAFSPGAAKVAPVTSGGIWKSSARLGWANAPSAATLESTNPDNTPFVQLAVPVGPTQAPIAEATFRLAIGGASYSGDLLVWRSPSSTSSTAIYDVPLSSNLLAALGTEPGSQTVQIEATFKDAAGNGGAVGPIPVTFTVVPPPVVVEEDGAFASYADSKSTYPYKLSNNTYAQLFDSGGGAFVDSQVRLVRFLVKNPNRVPIALKPSGTGTWTAAENWDGTRTRLTPRSPVTLNNCFCPWGNCSFTPLVISMDGFNLQDCYQRVGNTCAVSPESQASPPTADNVTGWFTHVAGDTSTEVSCKAKRWYAGSHDVAVSGVAASLFSGPATNAGEVTRAAEVGEYSIVPAATDSGPGGLVLYLTRPLAAARMLPLGSWNQYTSSGRYETNKGIVYIPDSYTVSSSYVWWFTGTPTKGWVSEAAAHQEIGFLTAATESLEASVSLDAQGLHESKLVGTHGAAFSASMSRLLTSH